MEKGQRVRIKTKNGSCFDGELGTVVYVRMAPPDYSTPEVVSVRLDCRARSDPKYSGTIYKIFEVELA